MRALFSSSLLLYVVPLCMSCTFVLCSFCVMRNFRCIDEMVGHFNVSVWFGFNVAIELFFVCLDTRDFIHVYCKVCLLSEELLGFLWV